MLNTPVPPKDGPTGNLTVTSDEPPYGVRPIMAKRRRPAPRRRWSRLPQAAAVVAAWAGVVVVAGRIDPTPSLYPYALIGHLVFLTMSFGAVLAVELHGLGFLLRRVSLNRMATVALSLDPLIWAGLIGMCATGVFLSPQLDRPLTLVKLGAVLVAALNGLSARDLAHELRRLPSRADRPVLPPGVLGRAARTSAISQLSWWTAFVIGFLTTNG